MTDEERAFIEEKRKLTGAANMSVYLRQMAMEGYLLTLDMPELKSLLALMHRMSSNINQIAKRINCTGRIYQVDLQGVQEQQEAIWGLLNELLTKLSKL